MKQRSEKSYYDKVIASGEIKQKQHPQQQKDVNIFEEVQFPSLLIADRDTCPIFDKTYLKSKIKEAYEKVIYWRRNLFEIPKGKHGKAFVQELTTWINRWCDKTKYQVIAFDALSILPILLLQKTSKKAKSKQNKETLERRLNAWKNGEILELVKEGEILQKRLQTEINSNKKTEGDIEKKFRNFMVAGNVKGAMRLVEKGSESGILPINDETKKLLKEKHPQAKPLFKELLVKNDEIRPFNPVIFDDITPELIQRLVINTNGAAGPSQLNAEDC